MHRADIENPDPAPSPCNNECELDEDDACTGCYRTIDEITDWDQKPEDLRLEILKRCARRSTSAAQP